MTWSVSQVNRAVHRIEFPDVSAGWQQWVLLTSDRHHDSTHCVRDLEISHLKLARSRNAPIIDAGDLFDAMGGRVDPRRMESGIRGEHKVDNYFDALIESTAADYSDYADLFAVLGRGNHEQSILKHNQINLTHNLCRELRRHANRSDRAFYGGYGGYVLLRFHISTTLYTLRLKHFHGAGGGGEVTHGAIQRNRRSVMYPDADIVLTGHIHYAWYMTEKRERVNLAGNVRTDLQHHITVPGYKDEYLDGHDGYHVERQRSPRPVGACWLLLEYDAARERRGIINTTVIPAWE